MSEIRCQSCGGTVELALAGVEDAESRECFDVGRCVRCGLGHTLPQPSVTVPYYGPTYHGGRHGLSNAWCIARRRRFVASVVEPRSGDRLLDVGCGDGSFLSAARDAGWNVVGTELRQEAAQAAGFDTRPSIDAAGALAPFRCITFWHTFEHMPNPRQTVTEALDLLAPDGVLVVAVPNFGGWQASIFGRRWAHLDVPRHLFHFDERSLGELFGDIGLRVERTWHQELEYDLFGIVQSASNMLLPEPNVFYRWITRKPTGVGRGVELAAIAVGAALTVVTAPLVPLAAAARRGGTLVVAAAREAGERA